MASKQVEAYRVVHKDRIWIDGGFSKPVRSILEDAPSGKVRFVFENGDDLTVEIGDKVVVK